MGYEAPISFEMMIDGRLEDVKGYIVSDFDVAIVDGHGARSRYDDLKLHSTAIGRSSCGVLAEFLG